MKIKLTAIALAVSVGGIILRANQIFAADVTTNSVSQTNGSSPFQIIVTPRKTRVRVGEEFTIGLEIKNISNTNQSFKVWNCDWPQNLCFSSPYISPIDYGCTMNFLVDVSLAPGESFRPLPNPVWNSEAKAKISQSAPTNKITFRMGFAPSIERERQYYESSTKTFRTYSFITNGWKSPKNPYWSNEVTIEVIPN